MLQGWKYLIIFADLMNLCIIFVENTQAQYFDNLTRNCTQVFSTMTIYSCIRFANINALFLDTYAESVLVFVRKTKYQTSATYRLYGPFSQQSIVFFTVLY